MTVGLNGCLGCEVSKTSHEDSRLIKRRKIVNSVEMARTLDEEDLWPRGQSEQRKTQNLQDSDYVPEETPEKEIRTSDREELIQCIKRGQRPTWVPKPSLEALCAEINAEAEAAYVLRQREAPQDSHVDDSSNGRRPKANPRPPSALHTGDFYPSGKTLDERAARQTAPVPLTRTSQELFSPHPTLKSQRDAYQQAHSSASEASDLRRDVTESYTRSRAPSLGSSLSSSFVMRAPTSPLAHAITSPTSEPPDQPNSWEHTIVFDKSSRRRTLPSHTFSQMSTFISASSIPAAVPGQDPPDAVPRHQARRSLTSFTYQPAPSSQAIFPSRHRRPSLVSDLSPRHRSSMIGSFEESILRGRMSTPPSKPLAFVAQIGVLGKGNCPAKLKCPAHVSISFPAVFYDYSSPGVPRTSPEDSPSPYVGTIDLGANLKPIETQLRRKRKAEKADNDGLDNQEKESTVRKHSRESTEQTSPGRVDLSLPSISGAYRVPQQGQLQVIIKNPNKTAVKLFLIPYDLDGMQPGTKTFVRQRSFSSGPLLDPSISTDPSRFIQDSLSEKQILRYLIHLRFCCLSNGRFYLYDKVRVVFANRVPEGKEKLRNEIQLPEPLFSALASNSTPVRSQNSTPWTADGHQSPRAAMYETFDALSTTARTDNMQKRFASAPIPFHPTRVNSRHGRPDLADSGSHSGNQDVDVELRKVSDGSEGRWTTSPPQSPEVHGFDKISVCQRGSPIALPSLGQSIIRTSSPTATASADGLLSRKLREMSRQSRSRGGCNTPAADS